MFNKKYIDRVILFLKENNFEAMDISKDGTVCITGKYNALVEHMLVNIHEFEPFKRDSDFVSFTKDKITVVLFTW